MSTILKALKKLEQEKARRKEGGVDLARDILLGEGRRQQAPLWPAVAIVLLLAVAGAAAFSLWLLRPASPPAAAPDLTQTSPATLPPEPVNASTARPAARVVTPERFPDRAEASRPTRPPPPSATVAFPAALPLPATPAAREPVPGPASVAEAPPAAAPPPAEAKKAGPPPLIEPAPTVAAALAEQPPPAASPAAAVSPILPKLDVTGIAFQDKREGRMAIVNGLAVMEGDRVEGARVEEIRADRVVFDFEGKIFETPLPAEP